LYTVWKRDWVTRWAAAEGAEGTLIVMVTLAGR